MHTMILMAKMSGRPEWLSFLAKVLQWPAGPGVTFWGHAADGVLVGVKGIQSARDLDLIRHAYVLPSSQRHGIGGALLRRLRTLSTRPMLVGTWAAAEWAIRFYERHGFELVSPARKSVLLKTYWNVPDGQIETSVVLANPPRGKAN
jgi:GNAT superfamily N-acetyltransferase